MPAQNSRIKNFVHRLRSWKSLRDEGLLSHGNKVELFFEGDLAYESMLKVINNAQESIHLEIYIFADDETGNMFSRALCEKAKQGLEVCVVYDSFGSYQTNRDFFAKMQKHGVNVKEYRPFAPWRMFGRNHRKLLIADSSIAFTGGVNISDSYSWNASGSDSWRDTHVCVKGSAARDCDYLFSQTWKRLTGDELELPYQKQSAKEQGISCLVSGSKGRKRRRTIRRLFSVHIGQARSEIQLTVPYFAPPRRLRKALLVACKRNVDVDLLIPKATDVPVADWVRAVLIPDFHSMGVRIREFRGRVLHAKTMVVDKRTAIIGSANFDYLSVAQNLELSLVVYDSDVARQLLDQHQRDLQSSIPFSPEQRGKMAFWKKAIAYIIAFFIRRL